VSVSVAGRFRCPAGRPFFLRFAVRRRRCRTFVRREYFIGVHAQMRPQLIARSSLNDGWYTPFAQLENVLGLIPQLIAS